MTTLSAQFDTNSHSSRGSARPGPGARARVGISECGLTLVEMVTTVAVLAVMLALAAPGLASFISANRLGASQSELVSAIALARSEATKRGVSVGVLATAPTTGAEFTGGWRVYVDSNNNGAYDADEPLLRDYPGLGSAVKIGTSGGATSVVFNSRGFVASGASVQFNICGQTGVNKGYRILLEPVGLTDVLEVTSCP